MMLSIIRRLNNSRTHQPNILKAFNRGMTVTGPDYGPERSKLQDTALMVLRQ